MESTKDEILVMRDGSHLDLMLNRPGKKNSLNTATLKQLLEHLTFLQNETEITTVTLSSSTPQFFCAGADLNWMKKMVNFSKVENYKDAKKLAKLFSIN